MFTDTDENPLIRALDGLVDQYFNPHPSIVYTYTFTDRATPDEVQMAIKKVEGYAQDFTDAVKFLEGYVKEFTAMANELRAHLRPAAA
jgi:hypothetical protein